MRSFVASALAFSLLVGCGSPTPDHEEEVGYAEPPEREPFDEEAAREAAEAELASEGYDYSYGCSDDCSGHEAGWQWRAENGYQPDSWSEPFNEGAQAFEDAVEVRVDEMRSEYE